MCPWNLLEEGDWCELLLERQQFAPYCGNWKKMEYEQILRLIRKRPELKSNFSKVRLAKVEKARIDGMLDYDLEIMTLDDIFS